MHGLINNLKMDTYPWNLKDPHSKSRLTLTATFRILHRNPIEGHFTKDEPETNIIIEPMKATSGRLWQQVNLEGFEIAKAIETEKG